MSNEAIIWKKLYEEIKNPYGVAGLMGNLYAESSLNPICKTGGPPEVDERYVEFVDNGSITVDIFAHDKAAFGLAQWCYWSRKEQLYLFAKETKRSIGDLEMQIEYLLKELKTYKTVWKTLQEAKSIQEASDIVLLRYEKPANTSDKVKAKRASYGAIYFENYPVEENEPKEEQKPQVKIVTTTIGNVNLRCGNGKKYAAVGMTGSMAGERYEWVATSENNWHAVISIVNHQQRIVWIDGSFCKLEIGSI